MTIKDVLVQDLQKTLEEAASVLADRLILESLAKNGKITLEEAEFYDSLVRRVVTEAADEFVPEELPLIQEGAEIMTLTGEDGTVYQFNPATCELTPVEGTEGEEAPALEDAGEGAEVTEPEMTEKFNESTEVGETKKELTESQTIVSNLIKSLSA